MIRTALKFGVFMAACLAVMLYLAFTIGNIQFDDPLGRDYYTVSAAFDDVTGLLPDDNVKIAGVVVGKVTGIKADKGKAVVELQIRNRYKVPRDATASIRWRNLIGQRYLYVNPVGARAADVLKDGDRIERTESVVDLGELFNRLGPIVASLDSTKVNQFLDTVSGALDGQQDKVGQAIDDLATLAKSLGERDQTIARLVDNLNTVAGTITDRDQQIRVMLDNLVVISQTFSENTQTIDAALKEFGRFSSNLDAVLQTNRGSLDRIIDNLDAVTTDVVAPRIGTLESALMQLDRTSRSIFESSDLGEWLNQSILCAATGPPGAAPAPIVSAATGVDCAGIPPVLSSGSGTPATGASAPAPTLPAAPTAADTSIGSQAASRESGVNVLQRLLGVGG